MAQAGGPDGSKADAALKAVEAALGGLSSGRATPQSRFHPPPAGEGGSTSRARRGPSRTAHGRKSTSHPGCARSCLTVRARPRERRSALRSRRCLRLSRTRAAMCSTSRAGCANMSASSLTAKGSPTLRHSRSRSGRIQNCTLCRRCREDSGIIPKSGSRFSDKMMRKEKCHGGSDAGRDAQRSAQFRAVRRELETRPHGFSRRAGHRGAA